MTAWLPLSETFRVGFHFVNNTPADNSQHNQTTQQYIYPRVYLLREHTREGLCGSSDIGASLRHDYLDFSWDEYCCLVQSKSLALNIVSFRDLTSTQRDANLQYTYSAPHNYRLQNPLSSNFIKPAPRMGATMLHVNNLNYGLRFGAPCYNTSHNRSNNGWGFNAVNNPVRWNSDPRNQQRQDSFINQNATGEPPVAAATAVMQRCNVLDTRSPNSGRQSSLDQPQHSTLLSTPDNTHSNISTPHGGRSSTAITALTSGLASDSAVELSSAVLNSEDDNRLVGDSVDEIMSDYDADVEVAGEHALGRDFLSPITESYPTAPTASTTLRSK